MPAEFGRRSRAIVVMLAVLLVAGSFGATLPISRAAEPEPSVPPTTSPSADPTATPSADATAAPVSPTVQAAESRSGQGLTPEPEPGPPSDADEREDLRTESSLTYEEPDGSRVTELYPGPINYRVDGGSWLPIDLDFKSDPGDAKAVAVDASPIGLRVAPASDGEGFLTLAIDGYEIHLRPVDTPPAKPTDAKPAATGSVADVTDALPGIDLRVSASASGVNSFFILEEADQAAALEFVLDAPGLQPSLDNRTGAIALRDRSGATIASMLAPYAVDSTPDEFTGGGRITSAVSYTLAEVDGRQIVTITVDPAWLAKATYPVYVDPTIYNNGSATYGDAHVNQGNPSLNYANYQRPDSPGYYEMWLGESPSDSSYYNEAFIKFDLSSIAGTTIDSANLEVRPYHQYYNAPTSTTTWLRRVTATWAENTIKWSNKPSAATGPIDTTGCVEGQQCAFAITALVRGWLDGTYSNYGVRLDENGNGPTYWKRLIASEEQTSTRPRLIITNHVPVASTTTGTGWTNSRTLAWSYSDSGGHAQSHYEVDVSTVSNFATFVYDGAATAGAGTSFSIPGGTTLTDGTTYHWRVRVKDGTSWSAWDASSIQWDAAAPTGGSISVNAGAAYATSASVTLSLAATDANSGGVQMQPSDDGVNGTWVAFTASPAWTLPGADGTKTVYVRYRDAVQNTTGWLNDTIVLDTADPTASIAINNGAATTATQSVTLDIGSGDATSGVASTTASNDNSVFTTVTGPAAAWTLTAGDGTKTVWFKVTDNAGRITTVSDSITLATDTTPPGAPSTPDLDAASDSGASSTDDVTNDDTPTFSGTAEANSTITIYSGAVAKGTGTANGSGAWTVTTSALTDAVHSITATATDAANNVSPTSSALSVTIDTTAPSAPSTPDLDDASDTGASSTDNITNDSTPTFSGSAESGTTLTIYSGAVAEGTGSVIGGTWTITASSVAEGTSAITAKTTDLAGNTSAASSGLSLTIDTVVPTSPSTPDMQAASDTGASTTDDVTNDATPTLVGVAEAGTNISVVSSGAIGSGEALGGDWSIITTTLTDGDHSVHAVAVDLAGNMSSPSDSLMLTIDSAPPTTNFTAPDENSSSAQMAPSYSVAWTEQESGSGIIGRSLQQARGEQVASGTCAGVSWANDGSASSSASPVQAMNLSDGQCYVWVQSLVDVAGNTSATTSGSVRVGTPTANFTVPNEATTLLQSSSSISVSWTESGLGITSRSLQRQRGPVEATGTCNDVSWADDGSPSTEASPVSASSLSDGFCYRWIQTLTDEDGRTSSRTSGSVLVDRTAPAAIFSSPLSDIQQASNSLVVAWTEVESSSGVATREIQRQRMPAPSDGTCLGFNWIDDGSATQTAGPISATGLAEGWCYRWSILLIDAAGNNSTTRSLTLMIDGTAPTADFVTPNEETTVLHGSVGLPVRWLEDDASSAVAQRSLQRQKTTAVSGSCGTSWSNDGAATSVASPALSTGLSLASCYRWILTLDDPGGNEAQLTSGTIRIGDVALTGPIESQTVFDVERLVAQTSMPSVTQVEFIVDGDVVATDSNAPYEADFDTTAAGDGTRAIEVRITQSGGATTTTPPTQVFVANSLGSQARLWTDYATGGISVDDLAANGVYASLSANSLPSRYRTDNPDTAGENLNAYVDLRPQLQQSTNDAIDALLAQPLRGSLYQPTANIGQAEPNFVGCGNTHTSPAGNGYPSFTVTYCATDSDPSAINVVPPPSHFKLIYVVGPTNTPSEVDDQDDGLDGGISGNGIPDLVDKAGAELEDAYQLFQSLGFAEPLPAGEQINVTFAASGPTGNEASSDWCGLGGITLNINPADPERLLAYAAPHELFHAFQFGYREPCSLAWSEFRFWMEATAEWGTHRYVTHRRASDPTFAPLNEWTGDVGAYLGTPDLELSAASPLGEGREYGTAVLAQYLTSELPFSTPVLRTWQLIGSGQGAKEAIANVLEEAEADSFPTFLAGWAQAAYQLSLSDPNPESLVDPDLEAWQLALENYATRHISTEDVYTGPDSFGSHRPARVSATIPTNDAITGEGHLGEQGMSYVDLSPGILDGFITVDVQRPDENVHGVLVAYGFIDPNDHEAGTLPCGNPSELAFSGSDGSATVQINTACPFATLMLVRPGPASFSLFGSPIKWSATAWVPQG